MKTSLLLAATVAMTALAGAALAAPVSVTDQQTQTGDGQNFNFSFTGLTASDGTGGTLVLRARGDYADGNNESPDWNAEGIVGANNVGAFNSNGTGGNGGPFDFVTRYTNNRNYDWQRTYTLNSAQLDALLSDCRVNVFVDLNREVDLSRGETQFVKVAQLQQCTGRRGPLAGRHAADAGCLRPSGRQPPAPQVVNTDRRGLRQSRCARQKPDAFSYCTHPLWCTSGRP